MRFAATSGVRRRLAWLASPRGKPRGCRTVHAVAQVTGRHPDERARRSGSDVGGCAARLASLGGAPRGWAPGAERAADVPGVGQSAARNPRAACPRSGCRGCSGRHRLRTLRTVARVIRSAPAGRMRCALRPLPASDGAHLGSATPSPSREPGIKCVAPSPAQVNARRGSRRQGDFSANRVLSDPPPSLRGMARSVARVTRSAPPRVVCRTAERASAVPRVRRPVAWLATCGRSRRGLRAERVVAIRGV